MLIRDLTKVWISEYTVENDHGEKNKTWKYKETAYLNLQQDLNELDKNTAGLIDYDVLNARTTRDHDIVKDNGISLEDISEVETFIPDYRVTDCPKIANTTLYKLERYNGNDYS